MCLPTEPELQVQSDKDRLKVLSPISRRFVILTILVSSIITLTLTALQLYLDYRRDVTLIESRFVEVEQAHLANIANALWVANDDNIALQLRGIVSLPDMLYLAVQEDERLVASAGEPTGRSLVQRDYVLRHDFQGQAIAGGGSCLG